MPCPIASYVDSPFITARTGRTSYIRCTLWYWPLPSCPVCAHWKSSHGSLWWLLLPWKQQSLSGFAQSAR